MQVPFLDLNRQHQALKKEIFSAFSEVYDDLAFSGGKHIEDFENKFAQFSNTKHAIAVNNGTSALQLAILALGIREGDEVIIPANTFIATAWGVSHAGATPVFVDCLPDTWQIDPIAVEQAINNKTKAIIGVHLYGQPCNMDALLKIAEKYDLFVIEDAAQAHGAIYKGEIVGSIGDIACFSFYPGKNLGACGEAGAITTISDKYAKKIRKLRNHGSMQKYVHDEIGFNMRMGGLEAASLIVKLNHLKCWNQKRDKIANKYFSAIKNKKITFQSQPKDTKSVFHLFVVTVPNREDFIQYLSDRNIFPGLHYPIPCHLQQAYANLNYKKGDFPNSEYLSDHCVSLPIFAELREDEVEYVINVINAY